LDLPIRVARESASLARMHRLVLAERPAAELRAAIVVERLLELRARVHDERTVLRDRLGDRRALEHEDLDWGIEGGDTHGLVACDVDRRRLRDDAARDVDLRP